MSDIVRDTIASLTASLTQQSSFALPPLGYGIDLICISDIDPLMNETNSSSYQSLAQDSFHRIATARGSLPDDPNYGIDVRSILSVGVTAASQRSIASAVHGELMKDDRIDDVESVLTISGSSTAPTYTLVVTITPKDGSGAFDLVMTVTSGEALLKEILK